MHTLGLFGALFRAISYPILKVCLAQRLWCMGRMVATASPSEKRCPKPGTLNAFDLLTLLSLQGLDERSLLPADVGAGAIMHK